MSQTSATVLMVLLFGVFQVTGGILIGIGIRDLLNGSAKGIGSISAGAFFGGAAVLMSALMLRPINQGLFLLGVFVFIAATGTRLLVPQDFVDRLGAGTFVAIGVGIVVLPIGLLVGIESFRQDETFFGLLFGGCWTVVGGSFFLTGIGALVGGKPLALRYRKPGEMEIVPADEAAAAPSSSKRRKKTERNSDGTQDSPHRKTG